MPKHPLISIPLDIPAVRVRQTERTKAGELILTVESTLSSTNCRRYGRTITERHGVDVPRLLRHLPILGRIVYLRIRPKRCRCPWCDDHPTTTQQLDWYDPNALHTKVYERHLIVQMVNSTLTDGEAKEDVTAAALLGILDRGIAKSVEWDALAPFTTVGIDEIALLKGQRDFVAVISAVSEDGELHVLAVLPDRLKATLLTWLLTIPAAIRSRITTVCTDVNQWCINTLSDQWEPKIIGISHLDTSQIISRLRHRVIAALRPGVAARDPLGAQPATFENAVLLDRLVGIGRAARRVDTAWRQRRTQELLIEANQQQKRPVDDPFHWRTVSQIRCGS